MNSPSRDHHDNPDATPLESSLAQALASPASPPPAFLSAVRGKRRKVIAQRAAGSVIALAVLLTAAFVLRGAILPSRSPAAPALASAHRDEWLERTVARAVAGQGARSSGGLDAIERTLLRPGIRDSATLEKWLGEGI